MHRRRTRWATLGFTIALLAATASGGPVAAADPTAAPSAGCADPFATPGPAGVDLGLACTTNEVVDAYTDLAGPARTPTELLVGALAVGLLAALLVMGAWTWTSRAAGRRLAPTTPAAWWVCERCHSLNKPTVGACYACGAAWTPAAGVAPTAETPTMDQRIGRPFD
jgi:heme A synthase